MAEGGGGESLRHSREAFHHIDDDVDNTSTMLLHPGMVHWEGEREREGGRERGEAFHNLPYE